MAADVLSGSKLYLDVEIISFPPAWFNIDQKMYARVKALKFQHVTLVCKKCTI